MKKTILALIMFLTLTGCATRLARPHVPLLGTSSPATYTVSEYSQDVLNYNVASGSLQAAIRNKMVYSLMAEIDYAFYDYENKLFLHESSFNVSSDILQLGLSAAGTITNGARAKTVIASVLTGVTGSSLSISKNLFGQQTVQAISSSMESDRDRIRAEISGSLTKDTASYPFSAARSDLTKYFFAGTLSSGLEQLVQQSAVNAQTQKSNLSLSRK